VWQHGGFLKDRTGQLDKKHVVCKHCGKLIKYVGSPSQLSKHLLLVHKMNPNDSESATVDRSLSQSKITDFSGGQASVKKYAKMNPIAYYLNKQLVSLSIVFYLGKGLWFISLYTQRIRIKSIF